MKKSILIMAFFAIGLTTTIYGQFIPRPIECIDLEDPLNVVPGQPYTYEVTVPNPPGAKTYHWFVTQDVNMIASGSIIATIETVPTSAILASGSVNYNDPAAIDPTVTLTFQSFQLATGEYVFLGILVENTDATLGCTTNNFKVYRIKPVHAFSLDMANVNGTGTILNGYGQDDFTQCMSDIVTANFQPNAGDGEIVYDFGNNTFYYAVTAANFSGSWQLKVQLAGLTLSQLATITWGYTFATAGDNGIASGVFNGSYTSATAVVAQDPSGTVGPDGEIIYIKMVIAHGSQFEGITFPTTPYSLATNGNILDESGIPITGGADVHHVTPCAQADFDDIALQSLIPRPAVNSVTPPAPGYLPIAP